MKIKADTGVASSTCKQVQYKQKYWSSQYIAVRNVWYNYIKIIELLR